MDAGWTFRVLTGQLTINATDTLLVKQRNMMPRKRDDHYPKAVLVTGGAGFIGSHVAIRLVKRFPEIKVGVANRAQ